MSQITDASRSLAPSPFVVNNTYSDSNLTALHIDLTFKTESDLTHFACLVDGVQKNCFQSLSSLEGRITLSAADLRTSLFTIFTACPHLEIRLSQIMKSIQLGQAKA